MDTQQALGIPYRERVLDVVLQEALLTAGAVLLEGPRACGKTMTGMNAANSYVLLDDPTSQELLVVAPDVVLAGERPRLLDEWQVAPEVWNRVRRIVDRSQNPGQFILTGSSVPDDDETRHTGAGRFFRLRQYTLSWWERGLSTGAVSLAALFDGADVAAAPPSEDYESVVGRLCASGFPGMQSLDAPRVFRLLNAYLEDIARTHTARIADVRHDPSVLRRLMAALARASSSEISFRTLTADLQTIAPSIGAETVGRFVGLLERLFVVDPQKPWTPDLRSRARIRTQDKWHLADPALAAAALGANAAQLTQDPSTVGLLFESAVVHDLRVLASPLDGQVRHYRDSNGYEIDVVIVLPDGRWGAVEVKLAGSQFVLGAERLAAAVAQIDSEPVFRLVITGTGSSLTLADGTLTCPLGALRP